jgi:hypothetical protein
MTELSNTTAKRYNHAFSIGFAVGGSSYEDAFECWENERDAVIRALLARVVQLKANNAEYLEAFDSWDTYEE